MNRFFILLNCTEVLAGILNNERCVTVPEAVDHGLYPGHERVFQMLLD